MYFCFLKQTQDEHLSPSLTKDQLSEQRWSCSHCRQGLWCWERGPSSGWWSRKQLLPHTDPIPAQPKGSDLPVSKACNSQLLSSWSSPVTTGKTRSAQGEMEGGFGCLNMGNWCSFGAQHAGESHFSREAGLDTLMQELTPTSPRHQRLHHNLPLGLEPPADTSWSPGQRLPFPEHRHPGYKQGSWMGKMHECILGTYFVYGVLMKGRSFS